MKKMTKEKAEQIYKQVALKNNTTVQEVKKEIKLAMLAARNNPDPEVQKKWAAIPHDDEDITPEELLIFLSGELLGGNR